MVDGFILMAIYMPVMYWSDFAGKMQRGEAGFMDELGLTVVALLAFLIPNGYLLATRGQSIGKLLAKIRIVDTETDELLPFVRVYFYRYLWLLPISLITN